MTKKLRTSRLSFILCMVLALSVALPAVFKPRPAYACGICLEGVIETELEEWILDITRGTYWRVTRHVGAEMVAQKVWMVSIFWEDNLLPALMLMADQLTAGAMQQMEIVGAFMDAKQQLETQQTMQRIAARTHKDYHANIGLCEFGSGSKSLAMSDRKAEMNANIFAQHAQDRYLGAVNTAAANGEVGDKESRLKQFREKFCDPHDNNNGLHFMCDWDQLGPPGPAVGAADRSRINQDIDYGLAIAEPWTLGIDMVTPLVRQNLRQDGEEVMAMAANLYGHELFVRPPPKALEPIPTQRITNMQKAYMDQRAIIAKLSVAENSFNSIVGLKTEGTEGSRIYLAEMLEQLGIADGVAKLGGAVAPSYDAQMKMLTSVIYQNPDFYTNLYDKPANIARKKVAMEAIGLMQKFDLFKSQLRREASLSVLLELAVVDLQNEVENEINQMTGQ